MFQHALGLDEKFVKKLYTKNKTIQKHYWNYSGFMDQGRHVLERK